MIEKTYPFSCPVRIAILADFHNTDPDPVLKSLRSRKPEIIAIAGDFLFGYPPKTNMLMVDTNPEAMTLLRECSRIAPSFVSLGNHEFMLLDGDLQAISETGVTLLENRWTEYREIFIGGLSSAYYTLCPSLERNVPGGKPVRKISKFDYPGSPKPDLDWLDKFEKQDGYKILLCHHPEYYPRYLKDRKIDLICAGHCHGGQWRFYSFIDKETKGVYAPGQGLFPKLTSGIHDNKLVISCGLSNNTFIPRINNPTEIVYLEPEA